MKSKFVTTLETTLLPSGGIMMAWRHLWSVMVCLWVFGKIEILTSTKISLLC